MQSKDVQQGVEYISDSSSANHLAISKVQKRYSTGVDLHACSAALKIIALNSRLSISQFKKLKLKLPPQ